jgi:hypothetical protein
MAILFLEASRIVVPVRCFVQFSLLNEPAPMKMCPCYCLKYIWSLLCCHDSRTCHLGILQIKGDYRKTSKVRPIYYLLIYCDFYCHVVFCHSLKPRHHCHFLIFRICCCRISYTTLSSILLAI